MTKKSDSKWTNGAAMAGAAIGSAALAAAVMYATRRKDKTEGEKPKAPPAEPPESD